MQEYLIQVECRCKSAKKKISIQLDSTIVDYIYIHGKDKIRTESPIEITNYI